MPAVAHFAGAVLKALVEPVADADDGNVGPRFQKAHDAVEVDAVR